MLITVIILLISAALFVSGRFRSDMVALCALLALLLCQILNPTEALAGFSNSTVIMMIGLFIVGGGIFQTGLAKMIGGQVIKLAGTSQTRLFLLVMLVTALIGSFVSNTGTIALMLPIVVSMASYSGTSSRRLLMPLAFAGSMGGMMTLIGTPPNLIIQDTLNTAKINGLVDASVKDISFFTFLPVGMITLAVGIIVLMPLLLFRFRKLFPGSIQLELHLICGTAGFLVLGLRCAQLIRQFLFLGSKLFQLIGTA